MPALTALPPPIALDRQWLRYGLILFMLFLILAGLFPTVVILFSHATVYVVWISLWLVLGSMWLGHPLHRLLLPMAPFIIWMVLYAIWGTLVADYHISGEAFRLLFRFGTMALCMSVVTSTPRRFAQFASTMQWVLVLNLLVTGFLMVRPEYQSLPFFQKLAVDTEGDRLSGLWENANEAGLISLLIMALSAWATRFHAWIGRIAGLCIVYFTASRTTMWILVALVTLWLVLVAGPKARAKFLGGVAVLALVAFFVLKATGASTTELIENNPTIARVMDVQESRTKQMGEKSRMDLLKDWLTRVPAEPWYGYGLYTLAGGDSLEVGLRPELPRQGPHNLYLGIFLDVGALGLLSWLGLLAYQADKIRRTPLQPGTRHTLAAIFFILVVFSFFNHNMIENWPGWIFWSLLFLASSAPALAPYHLRRPQRPAFPRRR